MKTFTKRLATIATAATIALAGLAPAAFAQTDTTDRPAQTDTAPTDRLAQELGDSLARIKAAAATAIDHRFDTLARLTEIVEQNDHISDAHASSLLADYQATDSGLRALGDQIAATDNVADALELSVKIAVDYRVYLVVAPKSAEVLVSDTVVGLVAKFEESAARVQAVIDGLEAGGFDVTEPQGLLDGALADAAEAEAVGGPVADRVIGLSAGEWADPAEGVLRDGRTSLEQARDHGRDAINGMKATIEALRGIGNR